MLGYAVFVGAAGEGSAGQVVRAWVGPLFLCLGVALLAWTGWLTITLPTRHIAAHWDVAWGGFDAMLAAALVATGLGAWRRRSWLPAAAAASATLLLVDGWFDVLTSHGAVQLTTALVEAFVAELPLAALCVWIVLDSARALRWFDRQAPAARSEPRTAADVSSRSDRLDEDVALRLSEASAEFGSRPDQGHAQE